MLDPIIISYKLTTNVSVTYYRIQQYPVDNTYNINLKKFKRSNFSSRQRVSRRDHDLPMYGGQHYFQR